MIFVSTKDGLGQCKSRLRCFIVDRHGLNCLVSAYALNSSKRRKGREIMRFLKDNTAIETSEVAVIIAVVVLVAYGAYQLLGQKIAQVVQEVAGKI